MKYIGSTLPFNGAKGLDIYQDENGMYGYVFAGLPASEGLFIYSAEQMIEDLIALEGYRLVEWMRADKNETFNTGIPVLVRAIRENEILV